MNGTNQSKVTVTLRNPLDHNDLLEYYIIPNDTPLAQDWIIALKHTLQSGNLLEKNFCFMGFPKSARTLEYLCNQVNYAIEVINKFDFTQFGLENYLIEEWFHPDSVRFSNSYPIEGTFNKPGAVVNSKRIEIGLYAKHTILNQLHTHFERLQGTVTNLSPYYKVADYETKYAIRQLNIICHEMESLILSQRKSASTPEWIRPSQITTFLAAPRYQLLDAHRTGFITNGYDRKFGQVYMHWAQIGKTLFEVWRDENSPDLSNTICETINELEYYSGEFDIEWGQDVTLTNNCQWHNIEQLEFTTWLLKNNYDPANAQLSLGYLPIGQVNISDSFGTENKQEIWQQLTMHLDIYKIEINGISNVFDYCWTDAGYKQQQIDMMKPGYDHSSKKGNYNELVIKHN